MNAAKQEMFESVRSVVAGRLRDEMQVRELAHRVSEESTALRRRIERAVGYARAGLRLEACAEAEAEPSVFELSAAFEAEHMRAWRNLCGKNRLPVPDDIAPESLAEIEEAIAFTAPLRSRLALMRRLVLSDASAWHRLEVLRELVSRDPDNPAWQEDRAALEPVAADELGDRVDDGIAKGDLEDAETCVQRLEDGRWHWSGAAKVAAQLRAKLDRALAGRATEEARALVARLDAEWSAESEPGVRGAIEEWRALEQRMLSVGGDMPGDLLARVDEAESWLAAREADAAAVRENRDRVAALDRLAQDERATLPQLRAALRAAEQTVEGVPDDVRASAERRIDAFERSARTRRVAIVAVAVLAVAGAVTGAAIAIKRTEAAKLVDDTAAAIVSNVEAGRLDEAERQLAEAEKDPALAGAAKVADARAALAKARGAIASRKQEFASLLAQAGDPESPGAKPELVEDAKRLAEGDADQQAIVDWQRRHARAVDARRGARLAEGIDRAKKVVAEVVEAKPDADASWDGRYAAWESALADVQRQYGDFPEVADEVRTGRTAIAAQRAKTDAARTEVGRVGSLASLGAAATGPDALVAALEAYRGSHPDSAESAEFEAAIAAKPTWDAVMAWSALRARPTAALADQPQKDRDAAIAAIDAHLGAHPGSPYAAACAALKPLLSSAPNWRSWLAEKLTTMEATSLWSIERKDGSRWYCKSDPRRVPMQTQAGGQWKSVLVIQGSSMKEAFERFDQGQLKSEGPSPQMAFAKQLTDLMDNDEKAVNDVDAAFDAIAAIRSDDSVDGALAATLMRGLLESAGPELPECVRADIELAAKRIAREKPDQIDWMNPRDPDARARSRAARAAMREAVQVDLWRKAYASAVAAASAPLAAAYEPAGVIVGSEGSRSFLPSGGAAPAAGTALWVAEPPIGGKAAAMVRIGTTKDAGAVDFEPEARSVPAGTLVFIARRGGSK